MQLYKQRKQFVYISSLISSSTAPNHKPWDKLQTRNYSSVAVGFGWSKSHPLDMCACVSVYFSLQGWGTHHLSTYSYLFLLVIYANKCGGVALPCPIFCFFGEYSPHFPGE